MKRKGTVLLGLELRGKGYAATGTERNGQEEGGIAMAWQCQDTTCSGFAPQRTDTKGDGKEEQYGAVIEKTIA